ncbi:MAG: cell division protein FtsX [Nitrospinota bacterium]
MRWLRSLPYFLRQAIRGIVEGGGAPLVAIATIAIALLILGGFLLALSNLTRWMGEWGEQIRVVVYLKDEMTGADLESFRRELASLEGVSEVRFLSKERALSDFRERLGGRAEILDGLKPNPLPASLILGLRPENRNSLFAGQLAASIRGRRGVEGVDYGRAWVESFERVVRELRWIIAGVGLLLGLGIVLIISNTISLALYTRREEVEIRDLVGATPAFIRSPFLLEGFLEGLCGGGLALGALYLLYRLVLLRTAQGFPGVGPEAVTFLEPGLSIGLLVLGALLGVVGSLLPLSRYQRAGV